MKALLSGVAVAALLAAPLPAWSQAGAPPSGTQSLSDQQQNAPGTGGVSKPGVPGLPGSKSGPAAREPSGSSAPSAPSATNTQLQDQSKVPGMAGNKAGPSVREPGGASHAGGTAAGMSESEIKQAQQKLKAEGLYHGEIDGIAGPQTHHALQEFQAKHGLKQTGSLDHETMNALMGGHTTGFGSSTPPASGGHSGSSMSQPQHQGASGGAGASGSTPATTGSETQKQ